jgi:eukaryotic-like serine/threonine-protein kinase
MFLVGGSKLGPYEILRAIGAGGMGEVYLARDSRLNREVALKVSAAQYSERFEREAKAIAALNHPNICHIYDVGESPAGLAYLVMEYIEGASPRGPLPFEQAWKIASQIAAALEYAHTRGIIHRDLKPANIMITSRGPSGGIVKLLDFGLAKAFFPESAAADPENSPTLTMSATQVGVILGTPAYMSPEQATGKSVDQRADIWTFGVVFYELLTGDRLFQGSDISHTLANVLTQQPDLDCVPPQARKLLRCCLEKDPQKRLRDIGDAPALIQESLHEPAAPIEKTRRWTWPLAALALLLALAAASYLHFRETPPPLEQTRRYTLTAPGDSRPGFAISPDGRYVVMAAAANGKQQLWLQAIDAPRAEPIPSTEDGFYPFWSPDGHYIAFFADGKLKKVAAAGGPVLTLCDAVSGRGGSWSRDNVIIFSPNNSGVSIQSVPAMGGVPVDVIKTKGNQRFPVFLPDGRHFLYLRRDEEKGIFVSSLDGTENRRVLADVSGAIFAPSSQPDRPGHLLFVRGTALMAVPFDAVTAQVVGQVFPVADGVTLATPSSYLPASVSANGVLLYATGGSGAAQINQIGWYDRSGKLLSLVGAAGAVSNPALSPDEKLVLFSRVNGNGADIWLHDLNRGTESRVTTDSSSNVTPFWSPKGDRIVFASNRTGVYNMYWKAANSDQPEQHLLQNMLTDIPTQWTRDGRFIVYFELDPNTRRDIWVLPAGTGTPDRKPASFLQSEFDELFGQLSPDGHWMAFTSDRSGHREVYVRQFPSGDNEWPISIAGGQAPRWKGDGKELYYQAADGKMMAVAIKKASSGARASFEPAVPVALFDSRIVSEISVAGSQNLANTSVQFEYAVTADGKRFLINTISVAATASVQPLTVVTNWLEALKK